MILEAGKTLTVKGVDFVIHSLYIDMSSGGVFLSYECFGVTQDSDLTSFKKFVTGTLKELGKI
jgi:hypothetical protein